jgi:hypothetical protein
MSVNDTGQLMGCNWLLTSRPINQLSINHHPLNKSIWPKANCKHACKEINPYSSGEAFCHANSLANLHLSPFFLRCFCIDSAQLPFQGVMGACLPFLIGPIPMCFSPSFDYFKVVRQIDIQVECQMELKFVNVS